MGTLGLLSYSLNTRGVSLFPFLMPVSSVLLTAYHFMFSHCGKVGQLTFATGHFQLLEIIMLSGISQTPKDKYHVSSEYIMFPP